MWAEVVAPARQHGQYRTARALPIDYANLGKRLKGTARPTVVARPDFLEVVMGRAQSSGCVEIMPAPFTEAVDWNQLFRACRQSER